MEIVLFAKYGSAAISSQFTASYIRFKRTTSDFSGRATRQIGVEQFDLLLEPLVETCSALAVAALKALETEDSVLLVLPADHVITNEEAFHQAVEKHLTIRNRMSGNLWDSAK